MHRKFSYPFSKKIKANITQPTGQLAHENFPVCRYAVDFILKIGTPIVAADEGYVWNINKSSNRYFRPSDLVNKSNEEITKIANKFTNYVCLHHKDDIYSEYLHLDQNIPVSTGQIVKKGDIIGYVGLSGILDIAHLHFNAFKIENNISLSIPIMFEK